MALTPICVKYASFVTAVGLVASAGPQSLMAKADIESAFRLLPVHPDDFSRGAEHSVQFLYSIIMFQNVSVLLSEYSKRSDDIDRVLRKTLITYIIMTSLTTWICILVTATVS